MFLNRFKFLNEENHFAAQDGLQLMEETACTSGEGEGKSKAAMIIALITGNVREAAEIARKCQKQPA